MSEPATDKQRKYLVSLTGDDSYHTADLTKQEAIAMIRVRVDEQHKEQLAADLKIDANVVAAISALTARLEALETKIDRLLEATK